MSNAPSVGRPAQTLAFALYCGVTILLGAFLLFQVQPVISKMILPWFGGTPAVWSTCMLFFQVFLLGGYAYAHFINSVKQQKTLRIVHITLIVIAICLLPITPGKEWKPDDGSQPTWNILLLLTFKVGLPYFLLATTAPLVQSWFGRVYPNMSPYRLYALSNFGSLSALLTYPIFFEPSFTTGRQGWMWSIGFIIYGFLVVLLLIKLPGKSETGADDEEASEIALPQKAPPFYNYFLWIALPALASIMLLVVTHHISEDVAVAPFMWIVPLSLYLITFIICFDHERWYLRRTFAALAFLTILAIAHGETYMQKALSKRATTVNQKIFKRIAKYKLEPKGGGIITDEVARAELGAKDPDFKKLQDKYDSYSEWKTFFTDNVWLEACLYFAALFFICMVCHGELVLRKPPVRYLTSFYLSVSLGGAIGGIFVALVCPAVYNTYEELAWGFIVSYLLAVFAFAAVCVSNWTRWLVPTVSMKEHEDLMKDNLAATNETAKKIADAVQFVVAIYFVLIFWNVDEIKGLWLLIVAPAILLISHILRFMMRLGKLEFPLGMNRLLNHPNFAANLKVVAIAAHILIAGVGVGMSYGLYKAEIKKVNFTAVHKARNFYGVLSVRMDDDGNGQNKRRVLYHGTINHGSQLVDESLNMRPNSYYVLDSGVGVALRNFPGRSNLHVGVIGLGTGTLVVYGNPGDRYRYYEINPLVKKICLEHFTYIKKAREKQVDVKIVMGDARLSMEKELSSDDTKDDKMDVIVLDAFRSDAIPAHLITKEALEIYLGRLKSDGIIAVHISNRYLDLRPVVQGLAEHFNWTAWEIDESESTWVLFTQNKSFLTHPRVISLGEDVGKILKRRKKKTLLWTDQFSNLIQIMK